MPERRSVSTTLRATAKLFVGGVETSFRERCRRRDGSLDDRAGRRRGLGEQRLEGQILLTEQHVVLNQTVILEELDVLPRRGIRRKVRGSAADQPSRDHRDALAELGDEAEEARRLEAGPFEQERGEQVQADRELLARLREVRPDDERHAALRDEAVERGYVVAEAGVEAL